LGKDKQGETPLNFDPEGGVINDKTMGARVLVLGSVGWASIENELDSTFMTGGSVILQRMGYSYGRFLGRLTKAMALKSNKKVTPETSWDTLLKASKDEGWGRLSLNSGDFTLGVVRLILKDCVFCLHDKQGTMPRCHFVTGVAGGVADEITGFNHRVTEGRCVAKGDTLCEIILERVSQPETPPR